ncbi:MAG TPA: DUF6443 domain-containing protein [Chitinophaga sp.]|uniref:DUF6443 domain-containing protein n=1 Tax=Chitinophaga sp. TaxID=1869181 RepID=UPI002CC5D9B5|nr:DUF6443 domain-containing protein [Chitinophaga sp.]HVI46754.1 DUF6443 domain-containing protein [Chitinophaga sp.]
MIKRIHLLGFLCSIIFSNAVAQNIPTGGTQLPASPVALPSVNNVPAVNYVRTWEPAGPINDPATIISSTDVKTVKQSTQYFDGLGRPLQTVIKGISPIGNDLVTPVVYDEFGREQYKYLPYTPKAGNTNDGKFKTDPFQSQKVFYEDNLLNPGAKGENIFYSQVEYETSPLNRVLNTYAAGNSWAKPNNHGINQQYQINTVNDSVRLWSVSGNTVITPAIYDAGQLYKNVTTDETGNQIIEFKDKEGLVVLKKVQISASSGSAHMGWLCTYYVYDDLNNVRFVIPPLAVEKITGDWNISTVAAELCFQYRYDSRNRLIMKKVPGADSTEMIYDVRDRLVFTRDGNMRPPIGNSWLVTFYDKLNRPVETALYNSGASRETLQASMDAALSDGNTSYQYPGVKDLVVAVDDRSTYKATNSVDMVDGFDTGAGNDRDAFIDPSLIGGTMNISVSNPLPGIAQQDLTPLTYTFYDKYDYDGVIAPASNVFNGPQAGDNLYAEPITGTTNKTQGLITGTKVRVLGTNQWLTTTTYYNDKGRTIQVISDNISGGKDTLTTLYDFNGKTLSTYLRHSNPRSGQTPWNAILTVMNYDAAGRLFNVKKRINGNPGQERTIAANNYDELGQLQNKRLGVVGTSQLETLNYEYNIRGWLKGINKSYVTTPGSGSNWFGQDLSYDYGFQTNQYNGNIAGAKWKSRSNGISRAYGYGYDKANRITVADFTQQNTDNAGWTSDQADFSVRGLSYDANGNILFMNQRGLNGTLVKTIDSLKYQYIPNTNKLFFVTDRANDPQSKLGDFKEVINNEGQDYVYDANGNLTRDLNKQLIVNHYNHLNLPDSITILGIGYIEYTYDAGGNKLSKKVTDVTGSGKTTTTDYSSGFLYVNDTLQYINHEEGRIRPVYITGQPVSYVYDYFIKDHLGNIRMVLSDQTTLNSYGASMETVASPRENALFSNIDNTRAPKPVGYPQDNTTSPNEYVSKLNAQGNGPKIGPSIVLRVMAGDTIQLGTKAFYKSTSTNTSSASSSDMLTALLQTFASPGIAADGVHGSGSGPGSPITSNFTSANYQQLKEKDPDQNRPDKPKSYLNFVFFDDQFKLVDQNSGVKQVQGSPDELQILATDKIIVNKSGFFYVYTSNESAQDVFFDNIVVNHNPGPLLEETHYYPFGLTMAGISANALKGINYPENRKKYNGIEFTTELDLNMYDAQFRNLDPQIGRWNQIDPKIENMEMWSPFASNYDNPIRYNDFLGDEPGPGPGDPLTVETNRGGYDNGKAILEIKAGIKNLISALFSQITSINGMGPRVVYSVKETTDDLGARTAEISQNFTFDKGSSGRFLNWSVAKGAVAVASLTPAGKATGLNGPMLAAEVSPTAANEGVNIAEQAAKGTTNIFGKEIANTATRTGRDGKAVEVMFKDGSKIDINSARVKEWVPKSHPDAPAGILQKVKFDNFLPGSKGFKRAPTEGEINFLKNFLK